MSNKARRYIGFSLIATAVVALVVFIAACFKKKNYWAAVAAVAAACGGVGAYLIAKNPRTILIMKPSEEDYYFIGEKRLEKKSLKNGAVKAFATKSHHDIPRDEEATEAVFM